MRVWLQIQGLRVWSQPCPILSCRLWNNFYDHSPPFYMNHSRRIVVSYKQKVHQAQVNCLFKLAQEKSVVRWTDRPAMTIAVDLGRKATKHTNKTWAKGSIGAYRMGFELACIHPFTLSNINISDQQADWNQISSGASLGLGKDCIRFWARSDQNSGFHGNR